MSSDLFSEDLYEELVGAAVKDVAAAVMPGSHLAVALAPYISRAALEVWRRHSDIDQRDVIDALARIPLRRAVEIARQKVAQAELDGAALDAAQQAALVKYLAALPVTSQQVLHRWGGLGQFAVLFDQLPATAERMARLMPQWSLQLPAAAQAAAPAFFASGLAPRFAGGLAGRFVGGFARGLAQSVYTGFARGHTEARAVPPPAELPEPPARRARKRPAR